MDPKWSTLDPMKKDMKNEALIHQMKLRVRKGVKAALDEIAKREDCSASIVVRRAISEFITRNKKTKSAR